MQLLSTKKKATSFFCGRKTTLNHFQSAMCVFLRPVHTEQIYLLILQGKAVKHFVHDPDSAFFKGSGFEVVWNRVQVKIRKNFFKAEIYRS